MKTEIVEHIGQSDVLLPSLVAQGLRANDRIKTRLSILQMASRHAVDPNGVRFDIDDECKAAGLDGAAMKMLVTQSSALADDCFTAPGLSDLVAGIWQDAEDMVRAVQVGRPREGDAASARLSVIRTSTTLGASDAGSFADVKALTALSDKDSATLHRLVMELHKALSQLSADFSEDMVAGARSYGLQPSDIPLVEAFMRGVEKTRKLKFEHPGLDSFALRSGPRLTIQNDIGETDAHVVVVCIELNVATITYTDVHRPRAKFFTGLFGDFELEWSGLDKQSATGLGEDGTFYLVTGRYAPEAPQRLEAFMEQIGESLVFLIDWNKARKTLREWVPKSDAVRILEWAALRRWGHRGFLELGGNDLLVSAVRHAAGSRIGFGERLDDALGRESAVDLLKNALRVSAETLLSGGSVRTARDQIEADVVRHLRRSDTRLLQTVIRQTGLARDLAGYVAQFIDDSRNGKTTDANNIAIRARQIEEKADRLIIEIRNETARLDVSPTIERLANAAEQAIDEFEQAAFIASLFPNEFPSALLQPLSDLALTAVASVEAAASGVAAAAEVPDGQRVDSDDALKAVIRLLEAEHIADGAERTVTAAVLCGDAVPKAGLAALELARALERATDRLASFGHLLREHVLADLAE